MVGQLNTSTGSWVSRGSGWEESQTVSCHPRGLPASWLTLGGLSQRHLLQVRLREVHQPQRLLQSQHWSDHLGPRRHVVGTECRDYESEIHRLSLSSTHSGLLALPLEQSVAGGQVSDSLLFLIKPNNVNLTITILILENTSVFLPIPNFLYQNIDHRKSLKTTYKHCSVRYDSAWVS